MAGKETPIGKEDPCDKNRLSETSLKVGEAKVHIRAEIPHDMQLKVTLESNTAGETDQKIVVLGDIPAAQPIRVASPSLYARLQAGMRSLRSLGWQGVLLGLALALYLATRLFQISDYPIYFFTDEAVQTVLAADLVRDGFHSSEGEFLPTYFYNGYQYNLSASVYLQVLPYMLFGKSIFLTRSLPALVSLLAAAAVGWSIWKGFKRPHAWSAVVLLSITPAWLVHSRTAFETSLAVTFFAVFFYCYLMYRTSDTRYLYPAIIAGALTFYSYSPARVVIGLAALLLFFSDLGYHYRQRKTILFGFGLLLILAIPFLRFNLLHPNANVEHLRVLNSYWVQPISLLEKLRIFGAEYMQGLNPFYWYLPNEVDLARHRMNGYGHVFWFTFPFLLIGLVQAVRGFHKPTTRALLLMLLAAPAGAALVAVGITRILIMVIPLALLSALGLSWSFEWLGKQVGVLSKSLPILIFILLCGGNLFITWDALKNGPFWHSDYGLGGMQWGASQLFGEIRDYQSRHPGDRLVVSPSWANGTDVIARFFFPDPLPFQMASIEGHFNELRPLDEKTLFVMIPREYELMLESRKFTQIRVEKVLCYPDGEPGFYFVRLRYVDDIERVLAAEQEARRVLQESSITVGAAVWQVKYSYLDMGSIDQVFDGSPDSLVRSMEANPLVVEVSFPSIQSFELLKVRVGGTPTKVNITLTDPAGAKFDSSQTVEESPTPRDVAFDFGETFHCVHLRLEVLSTRDQEPAHVHLWEITFEKKE